MKVVRLTNKTSNSLSKSKATNARLTRSFSTRNLAQPIKHNLTITYTKDGYPTTKSIFIGNAGDNRISWLTFNLDELLWNLTKVKDEEAGQPERLYERYNFKLVVQPADKKQNISVLEFDGKLLEIPAWLTTMPSPVEIILVIEENQEDVCKGNVPDDYPTGDPYTDTVERFVAQSFSAVIRDTGFKTLNVVNLPWETTVQLHTLTKSPIHCSLVDTGKLTVSERNIGQKFDNLIRFLVFNKQDLAESLQSFDLFIQWRKDDIVYQVSLEKSEGPEDYPTEEQEHYWISWIPSAVLADPGQWDLIVLGVLGDLDPISDYDYYRFVSEKITFNVADNFLIDNKLNPDIIAYNTNFILHNGEMLGTSDDRVFVAKDE